MSVQHVPAWKRLGLKLKYASDHVATTPVEVNSNSTVKKRKHEQAGNTTANTTTYKLQPKRPRIATETSVEKLSTQVSGAAPNSGKTDAPKWKKSVTFTPDTKTQDGDSAQTIQHWIPDSPGSTPARKFVEDFDTTTAISSKKPKKVKKSKDHKVLTETAIPRKATVALDYLERFHHQRLSWKFNKNHETWILKHALSTEEIPSRHNLALASYLNGLKSVGARQRLADQSRQALRSEDVTEESSNTDSKESLLQAIEEQTTDNWGEQPKSQFHDLDRAKIILWSLGQDLQRPHAGTCINGQAVRRVKKNKSRTSRIDIESSSSSESETDSEESSATSSSLGSEDSDSQ